MQLFMFTIATLRHQVSV